MSGLPTLRNIINGTPVDAIDVEYNFQTLQAFVSQELINRDGLIAMQAPLTLSGPPSAPLHATTKQYVDTGVVPVGTIWMFGGGPGAGTGGSTTVPTGWAMCDGSTKTITDPLYLALFAVIGYSYGGTVGTNFKLPDLRGRFPVGRQSGQAIWDTLGEVGGARDAVVVLHNHTSPTHNHTTPDHQHSLDHNHPSAADAAKSTGSDHFHNAAPGGAQFFTRVPGAGLLAVQDKAGSEQWWSQTSTAIGGAHTHDVDIPALSGVLSPTGEGGSNTGNKAATIDNEGVAGTDKNLPPFQAINYIIRIG